MKKADLVLINGKVLSVALDGTVTRNEAVAVKDGKILAVDDMRKIGEYIGDGTEVMDCRGNTVLPGLCDDHCHASFSASTYAGCDLFNVFQEDGESNEDVIKKYTDRLEVYIEKNPDAAVIRGTGWNRAWFNGSNGENRTPDRHDLDKICDGKPIVLESYCQHNIWVNTKAIELSGLTADTPTPETGVIHRESDGYPAGIFEETSAMELIKENLPGYDYTVDQYRQVILKYQRELANSYGVTLICDAFHTENAREAYKQLAAEGKLTVRVRGVYPLDNSRAEEDWQEALSRKGKDTVGDLFGINTVKMFMEGEPCMMEPYNEEVNRVNGKPEDYCGNIFWTEEEGVHYMSEAIKNGFQIHMHSMGDRTVKRSIDCLEKAQQYSGGDDRNIIAHLMAVREEDIERMGRLNISCSCQPRWMVHDTDVEDFYRPCFGDKRALRFYPNKSFEDAGCVVGYGTDFPITPPPDPFHEIQCAMTRSVFPDAPDYERFKGRVLAEEERVDLYQAIRALTINGAYQNFLEETTGTIEAGKSADMVVLDCDIETMPVEEIYSIRAQTTVFKGKTVYSRHQQR
ncbi:MAG: amidohydrolase [Bacillota bacterium]|nr:amidohydrolase [Bacillota bacterium]